VIDIMGGKERETCGRCAMTSVTGMTMSDEGEESGAGRDPFGESRIEVSDEDLRRVSPSAWLGGFVQRIDEIATRLTYGQKP
jgi:hypothetical protein